MFTTSKQVKLSTALATTIALCYQTINTAVEYAQAVSRDPQCPAGVINVMSNVVAELKLSAGRIERRIPSARRDEFKDHYNETDLLRLENIKSLYARLTKDQQDSLESMIELMAKGETIIIQTEN
jgi:hypothetical protein